MTRIPVRLRAPMGDDSGVALIIVMAWGLLLMGLVLVVSQAVVNQIKPSDRSESSFGALSAAEAGLADITARLQTGTISTVLNDATNSALHGWVPVPGDPSGAEFTYAIDASRSGAVGEIRAFSTGRVNGVTRTLEETLSKRSTLDYVYMSDIETPSPDLPGAYSTAVISGGGGKTSQQVAQTLCARHWYETGPSDYNKTTGAFIDGNQRNLKFCQWAGIYSTERLVGRVHTNDVWRLENTSLASTIGAGMITSSCPVTAAEGLPASGVGCSTNRRYIDTSYSGGSATWPSSSTYQGDSYRPSNSLDVTTRNPAWDSVLDLPPSPALLKKHASEEGCVFTGPTRIRFSEEGGLGYMYVTSPDTKQTAPGCDGADGTTLQGSAATPASQPTRKVPLAGFTDLVIYVQNSRRSTEADDPDNAWDVSNRWAIGAEPTCTLKSGKKYPFVIPNDATDQGYFNAGSTNKGFPSEQADPTSPWYGSSCASGDLYVQGAYKGAIMLSTENNIIVTSTLRDSNLQNPSATTADANYGKPNPVSQSVLGMASEKFSYAYRPTIGVQSSTYTWASNKVTVTYAGHGLKVGDTVYLNFTSGGATSKDGAKTVATVPTADTYTITVSGSGTAGNVTAYPYSSSTSIWVGDWKQSNADNPIYDFALLAIQNCWGAQDHSIGPGNGNIYLWGSLAQKFRCAVGVGTTSGYQKKYSYDDRLTQRTPPYMLELSDEPWGNTRIAEVVPSQQAVGATQSWPLVFSPDDNGATVQNVRLTSSPVTGQTTLTSSGTQATVTSTTPGMVVITYEVVNGDLKELRRLPILVK
jgi:hypothetical protein